eukprot:gene3359-13390_t
MSLPHRLSNRQSNDEAAEGPCLPVGMGHVIETGKSPSRPSTPSTTPRAHIQPLVPTPTQRYATLGCGSVSATGEGVAGIHSNKESDASRSPKLLTSELERARLTLLGCYKKMASGSAKRNAKDCDLGQAQKLLLEYSHTLGDLDASLAEQDLGNETAQQLLAVSQQLGSLSASLAAKDRQLDRAEFAIVGSYQLVSDLNARLAAAEHEMSLMTLTMENKDVQIHELIVQLVAKKKEYMKVHHLFETTNQCRCALCAKIASRDKELKLVHLELEASKQENARLAASLAAKDADQAAKDADLAAVQSVLGQQNGHLEDLSITPVTHIRGDWYTAGIYFITPMTPMAA